MRIGRSRDWKQLVRRDSSRDILCFHWLRVTVLLRCPNSDAIHRRPNPQIQIEKSRAVWLAVSLINPKIPMVSRSASSVGFNGYARTSFPPPDSASQLHTRSVTIQKNTSLVVEPSNPRTKIHLFASCFCLSRNSVSGRKNTTIGSAKSAKAAPNRFGQKNGNLRGGNRFTNRLMQKAALRSSE